MNEHRSSWEALKMFSNWTNFFNTVSIPLDLRYLTPLDCVTHMPLFALYFADDSDGDEIDSISGSDEGI